METQQTEVFRRFVETKKNEVSDFLNLLGSCADKVEFLEDSLIFRVEEEFVFDEKAIRGLAGILGDLKSDLRLLEADMAAKVAARVAEFKEAFEETPG